MNGMPVPQIIEQLVERFERNLPSYKSGVYNETQVRLEFINPFFEALGWDVRNEKGYAEAYKDVVHEYSQKTADSVEAPDYCFRIGGTRKFFVEAKKPSVNVKHDIQPAFQVRRYAWSAKLPLSILTDFEEFAVYDCRIPPKKNDKSSTARIIYFNYKDYLQKWDEIESIFSRDSILKGSFDKYAETNKKKKGTAEVDDTFLKTIEQWREFLAKNIALRNPDLTTRELNYSVQKTIDRIIFLRICEDRGIEEYGQLMALQNGSNVYQRMVQIFTRADEKYNSGLFHFEFEKNRTEGSDELTPALSIDDKILKEIINNLYYPESPFEFSVLPADILGQVYEQFLGKVIRLTEGHQAKIENKPEVKKAGGVYYTPTYIVDYIVQNTLGNLLAGNTSHAEQVLASKDETNQIPKRVRDDILKTPKDVSKIKILDPACGSGSFLIAAYQYLLDWHLRYYTSDNENIQKNLASKNPKIYQASNGEFHLTTGERKRILLNNIYGVDIDPQAVEVTKLSLLLKVLEGENEETLNSQLKMFHERALPDLANNIKCGNSLIGPDFYNQMEMNFLNDEEKLRINVFDWNTEFKEIMDNGGFDVVIGNPPYVKTQNLTEVVLNKLKKNYRSAESGNTDIYIVFIEKGTILLNDKGILGFIVPHKFFNSNYGMNLREYLTKNNLIDKILHFDDYQVFKKASTYTCLLFLSKTNNKKISVKKINTHSFSPRIIGEIKYDKIDNNYFAKRNWNILTNDAINILNKFVNFPKLEEITTNIFQGPKSGADDIFILKLIEEKENYFICYSNILSENVSLEKEILVKYVKGKFIRRYNINENMNEVTIYPYDKSGKLLEIKFIRENYPSVYKYLSETQVKNKLLARERGRFKNSWWQYSRPQNMGILFNQKILTPFNAFQNSFAFDNKHDFVFSAGVSGAYGILLKARSDIDYKTLLGILNSKLTFFVIKNISTCLRGGFYSFENKYLKQLPISFYNSSEFFPQIEHNSSQMILLKEKLSTTKTPQEKTALQRQIESTDKQIDQLVYKLYGLTEEEIKIVEGV